MLILESRHVMMRAKDWVKLYVTFMQLFLHSTNIIRPFNVYGPGMKQIDYKFFQICKQYFK